MAANDFSEEQAIAIGSILSKIPAEQRSRVDILVQAENSKTLDFSKQRMPCREENQINLRQ